MEAVIRPLDPHPHEPARYVVIGLGGIGGQLLRLLAHFLHSQRRRVAIVAVDGDAYEERNRERMIFDRPGPKAEILCEELADRHGDVVNFLPIAEYLKAANAASIIGENDVVFCQPDNHKTRYIVERRCGRLRDVALFVGGNDGVEDGLTGTFGNVQVYLRRAGRDVTSRPSKVHPEIARGADRLPDEKGCGAALASAPQLLITNVTVAAAMLAAFTAWRAGLLGFEEIYFDTLLGRMSPIDRRPPATG
jgi:molybdopterin/thiamine biosynthesis adenylyltransferase